MFCTYLLSLNRQTWMSSLASHQQSVVHKKRYLPRLKPQEQILHLHLRLLSLRFQPYRSRQNLYQASLMQIG